MEYSRERKFLTIIESHPCPGEDLDVAGASGKGDGELDFKLCLNSQKGESSTHQEDTTIAYSFFFISMRQEGGGEEGKSEEGGGRESGREGERVRVGRRERQRRREERGRGRGRERGEGEGEGGEGEKEGRGRESFSCGLQAICLNGDGELYHHKVVLSCTVATTRKLCDQLYRHTVSSLVSNPGHTHTDFMSQPRLLPAHGCEISCGQVRPGIDAISSRTVYH